MSNRKPPTKPSRADRREPHSGCWERPLLGREPTATIDSISDLRSVCLGPSNVRNSSRSSDKALHKRQRCFGHLAPAIVDGQRMAPVLNLKEFRKPYIVLLVLERGF